jgi:fucose 4-O-acetylase-like acetyltransferase
MSRNYLLDNAKILMIFLVLLGHLIEPLIHQNAIINIAYLNIYSFHMPVFIMISGMLTKNIWNKEQLLKLTKSILLPFVLFDIFYEILVFIVNGECSFFVKNFSPYLMLWYLLSLFCWKVILHEMVKLKYPVLLSVLISVIAGYFDSIGYLLGLSRTIYFFPFFLIGYKLTPNILNNLRLVKIPKIVLLGVIALNAGFFVLFRDLNCMWLYGSISFSSLGHMDWSGGLIRFAFLTLSFITSMSILLLIPKNKLAITNMGTKTFYIYIWHGLFLILLTKLGLYSTLNQISSDSLVLIILLILAVLITYLLSIDFVAVSSNRYILKPAEILLFGNKEKSNINKMS